ncbi:MAG: ABC transporter substrate-binding protein [Clostridiales bacterium]|nr:ABC transporter substrate-binding protein [Clostridiales bacterium]
MKKLFAILMAVILCLVMTGCAKQPAAQPTEAPADLPKVGVIQLVTHVALDAACEGFVQGLADNGYKAGETVQLDLQNGQADSSNLATIADQFVANDMDLVLAIGTGAAQTMAGKTTEIPILGTAITDYEVAKLVESNEKPGFNVSGTSDMNPVADQIALLLEIVPEAQTVGVIYTSSEDNSILQAQMAKEAIEAAGKTYVEVTVTNSNDVQQGMQELCGKCDAVYIPTDNVLASSMPIVYGVAVEAGKVVIPGESGMCMAGGTATLGIDYYKLGYQTGVMAADILKNGTDVSTIPIQMATGFDYCFNATMCKELGIEIPEKYQAYAQEMASEGTK